MAGIFGGAKTAAQQVTRYTSLDLNTSALGVCIPLLWGMNRLGMNIIWLGNFQSVAGGSGGGKGKGGGGGGKKGGGGVTQYNYTTDFLAALCQGVAPVINYVWQDQTGTSAEALGIGLQSGEPTQTELSWLNSEYSGQALAYTNVCYVYAQNFALGTTPNMPNLTFEMQGNLYGSMPDSGLPDANPADIISDYILNDIYGLDSTATYIDSTSLAYYKTYCQAQNLLMSPYLKAQEQATQTLQRWAQLTNSWIFWNGTAMVFVPLGDTTISAYGATYTPSLTSQYALTPDDFIQDSKTDALVTVTRIDPEDGYNRVEIDNRNRNNAYSTDPTYWEDSTSVSVYGQLQSQTITADEVCDPGVATTMATLIGQRSVYIRNTYEFTLDYNFVLLLPGDIVTLYEPNIGLNGITVRITQIDEDEKQRLKFQAEECPAGIGTPQGSHTQQSNTNNGPPAVDVDPGDVNPPLIYEPQMATTGGVPYLWIGASGGANWGGCQVWISPDGTNYTYLGSISAKTVQGTLTANLASHADPDTTDTLSVSTAESVTNIPTGITHAMADAGQTAILIDSEIVCFGSAATTGSDTYNLTYLRRGQYNTTPAAHTSGTAFSWINSGSLIQYPLPQQYVGVEVYLKFLSVNTYGGSLQELSAVTAYTYTPVGTAYTIAAPTGLSVTSATQTNADGSSTLNLTASWTASTGPSLGNYVVEWSTDDATWTSQNVAAGTNSAKLLNVSASTEYYCRVKAVSINGLANSTWATANVTTGTLVASVPSAPSGFGASAFGSSTVESWTAGPASILYYSVYRANGLSASFGSATKIWSGKGTSYTDNTTSPSTGYTYFLTQTNAAGESTNTSGVNVTTTAFGAGNPYDFLAFYPGLMTAGQTLYRVEMLRAVILPVGLAGSKASCLVAPTGNVTMAIKQNGTSIGTINFAASSTTATFTFSSSVTLNAGDIFEVDAPSPTDATFASPSWSLTGTR